MDKPDLHVDIRRAFNFLSNIFEGWGISIIIYNLDSNQAQHLSNMGNHDMAEAMRRLADEIEKAEGN